MGLTIERTPTPARNDAHFVHLDEVIKDKTILESVQERLGERRPKRPRVVQRIERPRSRVERKIEAEIAQARAAVQARVVERARVAEQARMVAQARIKRPRLKRARIEPVIERPRLKVERKVVIVEQPEYRNSEAEFEVIQAYLNATGETANDTIFSKISMADFKRVDLADNEKSFTARVVDPDSGKVGNVNVVIAYEDTIPVLKSVNVEVKEDYSEKNNKYS